ncbi:uncharacterized protein N7483_008115 [Penicillium malachiteum]|uniref:uncharacterized protein n=1 Tax=Penicillium malachiteum TaxID=1324776 RepID=UPI0025479693|nr:uncharacterized protein N7483_008115 [Penicillium malachiteum]KAJ5726758.1 hypothetical protein N7483_008115 [Penicillium malachiteum]
MISIYTTIPLVAGRWLRNDTKERELRHIDFDFDALCQKVLSLSGSHSIADCEKIEGGSNRVFKFTFNDSRRLIVKLPFKVAGPAHLTTASEFREIHLFPFPRSSRSADEKNESRTEYIIMEHAGGIPGGDKWPSMTLMQRIGFIEAVYKQLKTVHDLGFPAYGSIYFENGLMKPLYPTQPLKDGFCIGPHCGPRWWDCGRGTFYNQYKWINRGPWPDVVAYSNAVIDAGLAKLPLTDPDPQSLDRALPFYQGSVETHVQLLEHARIVLTQMANDMKVKFRSDPMLFHPDRHLRNIFVLDEDPTVITGIIDWQSASIEPAFVYASNTPDFVSQRMSTAVEITPHPKGDSPICDSKTGSESASTEKAVSSTEEVESKPESDPNIEEADKLSEQLHRTMDTCMTLYTPKIGIPRAMHINFFRPFRISDDSWDDGAIKLQHELIQLRKEWNWLGLSGDCSYPEQTEEFLTTHSKRYDLYKQVASIRGVLAEQLGVAADGWAPTEHWELRQQAHKAVYKDLVKTVLEQDPDTEEDPEDSIKTEDDVKSVWPFDIPV